MCGVVGFWDLRSGRNHELNQKSVVKMTHEIESRGPDSFGFWEDAEQGLYFGHRRLSIRDLSEYGAQPMISSSGKHVLSYNGEIYNTTDLKHELIQQGYSFRGHSDTEVVLRACEVWGVEEACKRFNGMFAFALWDREKKQLFLARDRIGIKPFYWGVNNGILFFGSQLKSFLPHPAWQGKVCPQALGYFLKFNYITAPHSIYKDIYKVRPGTVIQIDQDFNSKESPFWNLTHYTEQNQTLQYASFVEQLETLLLDSVQKRMVSDVPLGAFLSGGIDSSLVVALMQKSSRKSIKTFSIGFEESSYNEAPHAKEVAQFLKTDHQELYLTSQEAMDVIPKLSDFYDEPFADNSQIPTYLVSNLARQKVVVSLSGDGGDELFLGYDRYRIGESLYPYCRHIPYPIRIFIAKLCRSVKPSQWETILKLLPQKYQGVNLADKGYKLADSLSSRSNNAYFESIVNIWPHPQGLISVPLQENELSLPQNYFLKDKDPMSIMSGFDLRTFLPECILTKVDRASMALGLEVRVPLLDHRIIEMALQCPKQFKYKDNTSKRPLREILYKHVPKELIERPKMGFAVPVGEWLRGPLKPWAEEHLSEKALKEKGFFNPDPIRKKWAQHKSGQMNFQYPLWGILMFQEWVKKYDASL